jgi:ankyrin repeat protein
MWAARVCGPHVVDLLLKAGANPIAVDKTGKNVIEYAVKNRDLRNTDVMGEIENHISAQTYSTAIQWAVLISLVALLMVGVKRARTHNRNPTVL